MALGWVGRQLSPTVSIIQTERAGKERVCVSSLPPSVSPMLPVPQAPSFHKSCTNLFGSISVACEDLQHRRSLMRLMMRLPHGDREEDVGPFPCALSSWAVWDCFQFLDLAFLSLDSKPRHISFLEKKSCHHFLTLQTGQLLLSCQSQLKHHLLRKVFSDVSMISALLWYSQSFSSCLLITSTHPLYPISLFSMLEPQPCKSRPKECLGNPCTQYIACIS